MSNIWNELDAWLLANAPEAYPALNPPASPEAIAEVEKQIGIAFPPSVRASFLAHDGEADESAGLFGYWQLLPLHRVLEHWQEYQQIELEAGAGALGDGEFDAKRSIPIMWFESEIRYIEIFGSKSEGALFELPRYGKPLRIAGNLEEFLSNQYRMLLSGELIVEPDFGFNLVDAGQSASGA